MNVLHLTADFKWTGPAEPMVNAVLGLRGLGVRADLACPAPPPDDPDPQLLQRARARGLEPVHLLEQRRGFWPWRDRDEMRRLRALVRERDYDVVHVHHSRDHLLGLWARRQTRARLVVSWHHGEPLPTRLPERLRLGPRGGDGLIVLSPRLAQQAHEALGWPSERVAVVPGSVDIERFKPQVPSAKLRASLGLEPNHRVVGVVARLQPQRRFELLLEALARASRRAPNLRLVVLGRGTRAQQVLHDPVRAMGLENVVIHAGHRSQDYVDVLSALDALVFLVPGSDGSCRAVLEAMAMGVPALVSSRGILPEVVRDGETGRVVPEDLDALAEALEDLWRDPARWQAFGKAARESVRLHHSIPHTARTLGTFYATLL